MSLDVWERVVEDKEIALRDVERLRWRCRRGMLEIDLFLVPFFENCYLELTADEKQAFTLLLTEQDPELHAYLMAKQAPQNDTLQKLVDKIRDYRFTVSKNQFL